jgi:RNA polymerase primary sigma factor
MPSVQTTLSSTGVSETYIAEINKFPLLTVAQEIALARRIAKGDQRARQTMIESNLRLVLKIAKGYADCGLPMSDLVQVGNEGLMAAVERFRPDKGAKLSTYAQFWIRQRIRRALTEQTRCVKIPAGTSQNIRKLVKTRDEMTVSLGRDPTPNELSEVTGLSPAKVARWLGLVRVPMQLDAVVDAGDGEMCPGAEIISNPDANDPSSSLDGRVRHEAVRALLKLLEPRDVKIIVLRFGLNGTEPKSLSEIGRQLKLTRERIRQLEYKSLRLLRQWWLVLDRGLADMLPKLAVNRGAGRRRPKTLSGHKA